MKESTLRRRVVQLLHRYGAFAVENPAWPGTPDVCTVVGWIELKVLRAWPTRTRGGIVRVPHLTAIQRIWHHHWHQAGGKSWFLLLIGRDVLLIPGRHYEKIGHTDRKGLLALADAHWPTPIEMDKWLACTLRPGINPGQTAPFIPVAPSVHDAPSSKGST